MSIFVLLPANFSAVINIAMIIIQKCILSQCPNNPKVRLTFDLLGMKCPISVLSFILSKLADDLWFYEVTVTLTLAGLSVNTRKQSSDMIL